MDGDRGLFLRGRQVLAPVVADPAVRTVAAWCEDRWAVPLLAPHDVAGRPSVDELSELQAATETVVFDLTDPRRILSTQLSAALTGHSGPAPVLRPTEDWLRAADSVVRGRVAGIVTPQGSLAGVPAPSDFDR